MRSKCKKCRYGVGAGVIGYLCNYSEIKGHTKLYAFAAEYAEGKPLTGRDCVAYEPRGGRRRRVKLRLPPPSGRASAPIYDQMRQLYAAGKNDAEISREVGTSKSYVARWRRGECLPPNQVGGKRCKPLAGG